MPHIAAQTAHFSVPIFGFLQGLYLQRFHIKQMRFSLLPTDEVGTKLAPLTLSIPLPGSLTPASCDPAALSGRQCQIRPKVTDGAEIQDFSGRRLHLSPVLSPFVGLPPCWFCAHWPAHTNARVGLSASSLHIPGTEPALPEAERSPPPGS